MRERLPFVLSAAAFLLAACSGADLRDFQPTALPTAPAAPSIPAASSNANASSPADVSGTWNWSSTEHLTFPPFVAQLIFGIQPEGPVTQLRCDSTGTMHLIQSGGAFTGSATQTAVCETGRGHVFVPPPAAFPIALVVTDGQIIGHSIHFLSSGADIPCPFNGVITGFDNGTATDLSATGRCIVPGHPKSPVPFEPPPAGTSKTLTWTASRP